MTTITIKQNHVGGFSVKVNSNDPDMFRLAIDTLKSFIPATFRSYCPALKEWRVSEYAHDSLHRWLAYASTHLRAQVEWLNAGTGQQQKGGWTPPPPPKQPKQSKADEAFAALHLRSSAPPEVVKAAYRALAQKHHPDHQGDLTEMKRINAAYELLTKQMAA